VHQASSTPDPNNCLRCARGRFCTGTCNVHTTMQCCTAHGYMYGPSVLQRTEASAQAGIYRGCVYKALRRGSRGGHAVIRQLQFWGQLAGLDTK